MTRFLYITFYTLLFIPTVLLALPLIFALLCSISTRPIREDEQTHA